MLKPKVIAQVLRQALRNGIKASLLMTNEGSLLAFAADNDKNARTYAAIIANVWATYKKQSSADTFLGSDPMGGPRFLLLQCEAREETVNLGILKAKADALKNHLEEPLERVASYQEYAR
ncbi:Ragulator complex protein lamtor2 [Apophysomyces sp. BC1034]|nr:Ragulator complex protein lamtor2 [Apophysomyces sp. BC1034]